MRIYGGVFDYDNLEFKIRNLELTANEGGFWNNSDKAKEILGELNLLKNHLSTLTGSQDKLGYISELLDFLAEGDDHSFYSDALEEVRQIELAIYPLEFHLKMINEYDSFNAIVEINSGAGGTEAQDWVLMLARMYLRFFELKGWSTSELDCQYGEVAGYKSISFLITGDFVYGHLRSEQGVHRLVRISPFDSSARRHTSFASVAVTPDMPNDVEVEINEADLRIDTYRASGAGGQHVNKTDSAVRITHQPSGIVVACQTERSQHSNKARAMATLKSKLFDLERRKRDELLKEVQGERAKIDFGSQIRSYVLHPYQLVKDLRTGFEEGRVSKVLDGELDNFIEAFLSSEYNR